MKYVICPETITSPAPNPGFMAWSGLGPNEPCGARCEVVNLGEVMEFRCWRGHTFIASAREVREAA